MPDNRLGVSHALAFWSKHTYAMDELYEFYDHDDPDVALGADAPEPLVALWNSEHRPDLIKVFEHAEADRDVVYAAVYRAFEEILGSKDSPLRVVRRRSKDPWVIGAYATPVRKKLPQGRMWLTSQFNAASDDDWILNTTLWLKGGRKTARVVSEQLCGVVEAAKSQGEDWDNGSVFLSQIRVGQHMVKDTLTIDLDSLITQLRSDLAKQTPAHLNRLIDKLKST